MFFFALSSTALAYPDMYFFDNFLAGSSPYIVDTSNYKLGSNGLWEKYIPPLGVTTDSDIKSGIVTSFNHEFMIGTSPKTAVPSVNLSSIGAGRVELQPGCAVVVYSDGDLSNAYFTASLTGIPLGFTSPSDYCVDDYNNVGQARAIKYMNTLLKSDGISFQDVPIGFYSDFNTLLQSSSVSCWSSYGIVLSPQLENVNYAYSPYPDCSVVWLLINRSDSVVYVHANMGSGPIIDIDDIPYNAIKWVALSSGNTNITSSTSVVSGRKAFMIPHIDGKIDLYSPLFDELVSASNYAFTYSYNISATLDFSSTNGEGLMSFHAVSYVPNNSYFRLYSSIDLETVDGSKIPIFLSSAVRYIDSTAIMVNGGYISVNNYEELVALLKENGIGGVDLSRITQLLEEINSGGLTGEKAKALIDALEQSHQPIVDNGNTGWNSTKQMFETYKQLFDFSGSSLHWLVVANNALFNIFSGIIMMCCVFIIFSRVFKS